MAVWDEYFSDWDFIVSLFPEGWQEKFHELKVLKFGRKFTGENKESDLLRLIFLHLAGGLSLRTTVAEAREAGIVDIVDVTLFNHFKKCEQFFGWCITELLKENAGLAQDLFHDGRNWKIVDGSLIHEPGERGSFSRIHFSMNLPALTADQIQITGIRTGESLTRFEAKKNDVFLADRGFMRFAGIKHVLENGGDVVGRFSPSQFTVFQPNTKNPFPLLSKLRALKYGQTGDWDVELQADKERIQGRICAIKQSPHCREAEEKRVRKHARRNNHMIADRTVELCGYLLIFTTFPRETYSGDFIVKIYRTRWQVELLFKRLKSLLELGQLHKYDPVSIRTYLNGKMLIALLLEKMIRMAEAFSP